MAVVIIFQIQSTEFKSSQVKSSYDKKRGKEALERFFKILKKKE